MSEQPSLFTRVGQWFKSVTGSGDGLPLEKHPAEPGAIEPVRAQRTSFWRPWARRDAAIASLQQGFNSLTDLMSTIRENLERQGHRQDEMLSYLSRLPEVLEAMPETQRIHGEALKAIGQQLEQQVQQQSQLTEILGKLSAAQRDQQMVIESLGDRVGSINEHNQAISENLRQVGSAMENMGRNSESSTQVLRQLHDDLNARKEEMDRAAKQSGQRFLILLIVAIVLSVAALAAVAVMGFFAFRKPAPTPPAHAVLVVTPPAAVA